jgi:hypothetical protein
MNQTRNQFNHIFKVVTNDSFLRKEAWGGEIHFFIAAYPAKEEVKVRDEIRMLKNKLSSKGIEVLEINLFDLACEILEEKGGMERMFRVEREKGPEKFLRALQSSLNVHEVLLPRIKQLIEETESKVYFLTGIGLVFPFIRSHTILNNLLSIAKESPTITFFPGDYNGLSLNLFGMLKDDNYYRAFNIEKIEA